MIPLLAVRPQRVLENIPANLPALDQAEQTTRTKVHAAKHARVNGLETGLRQALEAPLDAAGRRERISDTVRAEVPTYYSQPGARRVRETADGGVF